ncbi:MAG: glycosyltransferase [bacterium]|nr:glycosyltransferase [bacterium]
MTITIIASGTRGDVQPYIALAQGLVTAGEHVRLITSDDFEPLVREAGVEFASLGESVESVLQSPEWRAATESGNFIKIVQRMNAEMKPRAAAMAERLPDLMRGSDVIVAGMGGMGAGFSIAEKFAIPVIQAYVFPITPTSAFPSPLTPGLPLAALNRPSFHIMRQMLWVSGRAADTAVRARLGMSPSPMFGHYQALAARQSPVLYGYSAHVIPRPADWDARTHVTGYWFLDPPTEWTAPADLLAFLDAGAPPIYIGFGSMASRSPEESARLALTALERSGQRGVIASGWGGMRAADLPPHVFMLASAPHSWLFPRMAAVVHHGGAGTTAAGLRAGVPSQVVPFMGDQPYWGRRVLDLGVGPAPIPRRRLTADGLAASITAMLTDTALRDRAAALGARIRAEDGVAEAVRLIQGYTGRTPQRHDVRQPERALP